MNIQPHRLHAYVHADNLMLLWGLGWFMLLLCDFGPIISTSSSVLKLKLHNLMKTSSFTVGWLLEFHILATSKVISGWIPTCDSEQICRLYSAAPPGNQATATMDQTGWRPSPILGDRGIRTSWVRILFEWNQWLKNVCLPLPNQANRISMGQGLVGSVSG